MVWAGTDLWRLSSQISIPKQEQLQRQVSCLGLWAEHGEPPNSLALCFSGYCHPQRRCISLCACGLSPSFCPCDSSRGAWLVFFIKSFQVVEDSNKFLLKFFPARLSIPCAFLLLSRSLCSAPAWCSPAGPSPGHQKTWYSLCASLTHTVGSGDCHCSSSDTPGMSELWAVLATSRHLYYFLIYSPILFPDLQISLCW